MPWLLQIQSHSWDCGHIPKKLIAFPLDICQKWVWQTVGLFYINLLRNFHFIFKNSSTIYITTNSAVKILCFLYCACTVLYVLCLFWQGQEWITENPALAWKQESCSCIFQRTSLQDADHCGIAALWFSEPSSPTSQDFMTLRRLGPEIPTEQDHLITSILWS